MQNPLDTFHIQGILTFLLFLDTFRVRGPQKSFVSKTRDSKGEPNEGEVADYGKKQEKDKIPCELKNEPKT